MPDISRATNRNPITRYRFTDLTGGTVSPTMTNADEWYNLTHLLVPDEPSLDAEVGVLYVSSDPVGDDAIVTQWQGGYRARLTARIAGGGLLGAITSIGIMVDQAGVFPRTPLSLVPEGNRDVSEADVLRFSGATWQVERVLDNLENWPPNGSRIQAVISSTFATDVVDILSLELEIEHLAIARSGANL